MWFKKKKDKPVIKFTADADVRTIIPAPVPAHRAIPEWIKKVKPVIRNNPKAAVGTIKRCKPVIDACSQGYIIPLWTDLQVSVERSWKLVDEHGNIFHECRAFAGSKDQVIGSRIDDMPGQPFIANVLDGELEVHFGHPKHVCQAMKQNEPLSLHDWDQVGKACDLKKFTFGKNIIKFHNPWTIETPPGWSVQIKNPANSWSNDITLLEGTVDTDEYHLPILFPFVWTGSEEGEYIIPRGTPLAQVIPFKREETELEVGDLDQHKRAALMNKLNLLFIDRYVRLFWHKRKKGLE